MTVDRYTSLARLFNRLDAAVARHRKAKAGTDGAFCDDTDDALHHAHDQVLKDAARPRDAKVAA